MHFTTTELGALFLLLFGLFHWLSIFAKTRAVLAFTGVVALGAAGVAGRALAHAGAWAEHMFGSLTNWAIGVPLVAGLAIAVGVVVIHDLHPKKSAGKRTGWLALILGVFVVAGVAGIPALSGVRSFVDTLLSNAAGII